MDAQYVTWGLGALLSFVVAPAAALVFRLHAKQAEHAAQLMAQIEQLTELADKLSTLALDTDELQRGAITSEDFLAFKQEFHQFMQRVEDKLDSRLTANESAIVSVRERVAHIGGKLNIN